MRNPLPVCHCGVPLILAIALLGCGLSRDNGQNPASTAAGPQIRTIHRSDGAMGTLFEITLVVDEKAPYPQKAFEDAFKEIHRIEDMMSVWKADSHLSKVNANAGRMPVAVPTELLNILVKSLEISELTGGKFDITFAAMDGLWDFRQQSPTPPQRRDILKRLPLVDFRSILISHRNDTVMLKKKKMKIGLGAIAKGYAVDRAAAILKKNGLHDFIVFGGGDLVVSGKKGDRHWRVGIQDPRSRSRYFARFEPERNCAIVTSGDYEKFFEKNGKRYHHIIDPDTGYPVQDTVSVTVIGTTAAEADGLATGIFAMGPEQGMALIEARDDLEGLIVDANLQVHLSSGLKNKVIFTPLPDTAEKTP